MLSPLTLAGRGVRIVRALALALSIISIASNAAVAGPGHSGEEGHSHDAPSAASAQSPRVVATSEAFQIVGTFKSGALKIYVDREPDNSPVTKAKLSVAIGGETIEAAAKPDGTFEIAAKEPWSKPGEHEVQFSIDAEGKIDLLAGVLVLADRTQHSAIAAPGYVSALLHRLPSPRFAIAGLVLLGIGLLLGSLVSRRRQAGPLAILFLAAGTLVAAPISVLAGPGHSGEEGHAHGPEPGIGLSDAASRLPDGSVFVPKPTQRLLEVRTGVATSGGARRSVVLPGKVVAGPNGAVVEIALYDQVAPEQIHAASVVGPGSARAAVTLASRSAELKQNAIILTFTLSSDVPALLRTIGQRVSVMVEAGEPIGGVVLPRAAVVTAPNGQSVVFEHVEPERFVPKLVLFAPVGGDRVVVTSGLAAGDKIVVEAASLINQIR